MFGYAAFTSTRMASYGAPLPALFFMGCERVLTDQATGNLSNRPGYACLRNVMRKGDRLVLDCEQSLGSKRQNRRRHMEEIEADGIEIMVLTEEGKGMRYA